MFFGSFPHTEEQREASRAHELKNMLARETAGEGVVVRRADGKPGRFWYGYPFFMSNDMETALKDLGDLFGRAFGSSEGGVYIEAFARELLPRYIAHIAKLANSDTQAPKNESR